jgi:hypothetical protein
MAVFADTYLLQAKQPHYDAEMLLWPVNMWQVYTNQPQGRALNLFEKTILQLFNVSARRSIKNEDIAKWLGLEIDMVGYIITAQLMPNGWLTEKGQVTSKGEILLDEEVGDSLTTAYIFQCAITGKWLPRVCFKPNDIAPYNDSRRLKFKLNRASDYVSVPFVVTAKNTNPTKPSEHDLNSIAAEFQDAIYIAKNTRDNEQWQQPQLKFEKLTLASQNATPTYLTVWGDTTTSFEWTLFDPMGISTRSTWMTALFKQVCKFNNGLGNFALSKLEPNSEEINYEDACLKFAENANFKVLVKYPDAGKIEGLTDALFEMLESHERISFERTPHNSAKASLIVSCGQVLEVICTQLLKDYVLSDTYRLPKQHTKDGTAIIKHLIKEATAMQVGMLNEATKVQPSKIYSAATGKNSSLRAQLVAIFISMKTHRQHPLKFLLDDQSYFNRFYALTFLRDDCAHKNPPNVPTKQIDHAVGIIDTFLKKLFNGMKNNG